MLSDADPSLLLRSLALLNFDGRGRTSRNDKETPTAKHVCVHNGSRAIAEMRKYRVFSLDVKKYIIDNESEEKKDARETRTDIQSWPLFFAANKSHTPLCLPSSPDANIACIATNPGIGLWLVKMFAYLLGDDAVIVVSGLLGYVAGRRGWVAQIMLPIDIRTARSLCNLSSTRLRR